jgi:hypothetical protein
MSRIDARADKWLFSAFALLNTVGYNNESSWTFGAVRRDVRLKLAPRAEFWRRMVAEQGHLDLLRRAGGALVMDLVPYWGACEDQLPEPGLPKTTWQRESLAVRAAIEPILHQFHEQEGVDLLWEKARGAHEAAASVLGSVAAALAQVAERVGAPDDGAPSTIVISPNLLDAQGRGYSFSTSDASFLYVGPTASSTEAAGIVVHEYLHRWVDPIAERLVRFEDDLRLAHARASFRLVADLYPEASIWLGETIVRACTAVLAPDFSRGKSSLSAWLQEQERLGFIGIQEAYARFSTEAPSAGLVAELVRLVLGRVNETRFV